MTVLTRAAAAAVAAEQASFSYRHAEWLHHLKNVLENTDDAIAYQQRRSVCKSEISFHFSLSLSLYLCPFPEGLRGAGVEILFLQSTFDHQQALCRWLVGIRTFPVDSSPSSYMT